MMRAHLFWSVATTLAAFILATPGYAQVKSLAKLSTTKIESTSFEDAGFGAVLDYIANKAEDAVGNPVNMIVLGERTREETLSLQLNDIPISTLIHYACESIGRIDKVQPDNTILIGTKAEIAAVEQSWKTATVVKGRGTLADTLATIKLPSIDVDQAELSSVLEYLDQKKTDLMAQASQPTQNPSPNFIIIGDSAGDIAQTPITLKLNGASMATIVRYLSALAGPDVGFRIDRFAVVFGPAKTIATRPEPKVPANSRHFAYMMRKRLPEVAIDGATLAEAIQLIRHHCESLPDIVNIIDQSGETDRTIKFNAANIPLSETLRYICEQSDTTFSLAGKTITIKPLPSATEPSPAP